VHGLEAVPLQGWFNGEAIIAVILLGQAPLLLTLGLLTAAVTHSRWVALTPLLWVLFGVSGNTLSWMAGILLSDQPEGWANAALPGWIWAAIPGAWVLAGLILAGAIHIVSRQVRF